MFVEEMKCFYTLPPPPCKTSLFSVINVFIRKQIIAQYLIISVNKCSFFFFFKKKGTTPKFLPSPNYATEMTCAQT